MGSEALQCADEVEEALLTPLRNDEQTGGK